MTAPHSTPSGGRLLGGAALGLVVAALLGYWFFHDPGDGFLEGWLATIIFAVAGAAAGYLLARGPRRTGPPPR